jgi:hypothetical protein
MLGATPELNTRPGGKPLDPSIRHTIQASESTPNPVSEFRQWLAFLLLVAVRTWSFELQACQHAAVDLASRLALKPCGLTAWVPLFPRCRLPQVLQRAQ